ncbi:minor tail protein [Arthrobacter phage Aoka]|nr:minor tail protein [Arthrobacter phage Aoka]
MAWRFHAQSLPSRVWIDRDLALVDAEVTEGTNGPAVIRGKLPLGNTTGKQLREWGSLIVAEQDGQDPVAAIVDRLNPEDGWLHVEAGGFTMYPNGLPWSGPDYTGVGVDPLDMVRKIWAEIQAHPDGNLGVTVDPLTSPTRIGTAATADNTDGPFRLAWWATDDLGKVLADLATDTPFQYRERSTWDGDDITHRLQLGYPSLGARREELRFEVGVNITAAPPMADGEYASEVLVMGAGEGRKKVTSGPLRTTAAGRLRRVRTVADSSITTKAAAQAAARPFLARLGGVDSIESLDVINHPAAPFGSFGPGDEIYVQGNAGWAQLADWVRITEQTINCTTGIMNLKVEAI